MRELSFEDGGHSYRVVERTGTVEDIQLLSRMSVSSSVNSGGPYAPVTASARTMTDVTQRIFVRAEDGSEWTCDCTSDVTLRPGARVRARLLGRGDVAPALTRLTNLDMKHSWWWHEPVKRFLPRYRTVWLTAAAVFVLFSTVMYFSNASARAQGRAGGSMGRACYVTDGGCQLMADLSPFAALVIAAMFVIWHFRRKSTLNRLHEKVASVGGS